MNCYHHFTIEERTCLRKYYMEGLSFRKVVEYITEKLQATWSPEQIANTQ